MYQDMWGFGTFCIIGRKDKVQLISRLFTVAENCSKNSSLSRGRGEYFFNSFIYPQEFLKGGRGKEFFKRVGAAAHVSAERVSQYREKRYSADITGRRAPHATLLPPPR